MINTKNYKYKIIAGVLSLVMVIGLLLVVPPVSAQAVEINAGDQGYTLYSSGANTTTGFESGAQISVTNTTRTDDRNKTAVYTYNGTAWSKAGNDYVVWQGSGDNTFTAYAPVAEGASYTEFTLPNDQTAGVSAADWMTATYTGARGDEHKIDLTFQHLLAKVTVKVTGWGDEYTGNETLTAPTFLSKYSGATATYTTKGATVTGSGGLTGVDTVWDTEEVDGKNVTSATAILVPGTYSGQQQFFIFNVAGKSLSVHAPANLIFESGKHYTLNLTVGKDAVLVSDVTVEGWNPETLDGGAAVQIPAATYTAAGGVATITVPEDAYESSITEAVNKAIAASDVTTIIVEGTLTKAQQSELETALKNCGKDAIAGSTYYVATADGLYAWKTAAQTNLSTNITLMADINLPNTDLATGEEITVADGVPSGSNWTPISTDWEKGYIGTFDGNNHTITGLRINTEENYASLIGTLGADGEVKNLTLANAVVYGTGSSVSGFVAYIYGGTIFRCTFGSSTTDGSSVSGAGSVGGIIYKNASGLVSYCTNNGTISASGTDDEAGGIAAQTSNGTVSNCTNNGSVSVSGGSETTFAEAGGIVGYTKSNSTVTGCKNNGDVSATGVYISAGGIVGWNENSTVSGCENTGKASAKGSTESLEGGIVGFNSEGTVDETNENKGEPTTNVGKE